MTNPNYTHITLVADRSGSMNVVRSDAEGAVNSFLTEQKAVDGKATLLLVDFDAPAFGGHRPLLKQFGNLNLIGENNDWYRQVYLGDLSTAPSYTLHPRGGTALNDAVAKAIIETGVYLAAMPEDERPDKVLFVTQTDGQENSSQEYNLAAVQALVKKQKNDYSWEFVFLGMGLDAAQQGHNYGFGNVVAAAANTGASYATSYAVLGSATRAFRTGATKDMTAANVLVDESGEVSA